MTTYFETAADGVKVDAPALIVYVGEGSGEGAEPLLIPVRMTWGINGRSTTLELRANLGGGPGPIARKYPESTTLADASERIRVTAVSGSIETDLFIGYVAQEAELYQAEQEALSYVAYGPEILLNNTVVHGQWHAMPDTDTLIIDGDATGEDAVRANVFASDLPVVFNPDGKPNASTSIWKLGTGSFASAIQDECVFEDPERRIVKPDSSGALYEAVAWTAYTAMKSLLSWYEANTTVNLSTLDIYESDLDIPIGSVSVEGLTLLEALSRILIPVGFGFTITPWQTSGVHTLTIFPLHSSDAFVSGPKMEGGSGGNVTMTSLDGEAAQVQRFEFLRDAHNIRNDVEIIGDQIRTQQAFIFDGGSGLLKPGWDTTIDDLSDWQLGDKIPDMDDVPDDVYADSGSTLPETFVDQYSIGGSEYLGSNRNAFRLFAANDDGWLSQFGEDFADLSAYGKPVGSAQYDVHRRRPLGRTLIQDLTGTRWRNAYVEIGIIGDNNSWIILKNAKVLQDHLGFRIDTDRIDKWKPYEQYATKDDSDLQDYADDTLATLLNNTLQGGSAALGYSVRFRLVGTIENDAAVIGSSPRQAQSLWTFDSERRVSARSRYKLYEADYSPTGTLTRDDSTAIEDASDALRDLSEDAVGHGSFVLRVVTTEWQPGTAIGFTSGNRVIGLDVDNGGVGYWPIVTQLVWNFDEQLNTTELVLDTPLLKVST